MLGPSEGHVVAQRYELTGALGVGAGTRVFRARDLLSGAEVAVKLIEATAIQKAFTRDLALLRDYWHPNVVRIFNFGEAEGAFYVAMELTTGTPLSYGAIDGRNWSESAVLEVFEQIVSALDWFHSHGIAHGDIRPSNVLWRDGTVKLMEFGTQRDSRQATLYRPDATCPYASPERLLGRPLKAASDFYSAAAVIYQLLAGEPPHEKAGLLERAISKAPRFLRVSEKLAAILERCLDPDPTLRPVSAAEIAEECRKIRSQGVRSAECGVEEPALADRMRERPLDVPEMTGLLLAICRFLRSTHDAGLGHPDLSPQNIRVTEKGQVEIPTFPAPPPNATLGMSEPKYAAPEMLLTNTTSDGNVHLRSDIYVLGFVTYEALAGPQAFRRQLLDDTDAPETDLFWLKWHADSSRHLLPLSDVNPSVPQDLSLLIQRMMEKDPAERPYSLNDVEGALTQLQRRFQTTEDIEVAVTPATDHPERPRVTPPGPKRKIFWRPLLLVCMLTLIGLAWWKFSADLLRSSIVIRALSWVRTSVDQMRTSTPKSIAIAPATTIETSSGTMVLVPAGSFVMGSNSVPNENPAHTVYVPAFYIDKYEVSNGKYKAFTNSTGYRQPSAPSWDSDYFAKAWHPVINVSWGDAQAFCVAAGKRLPTEFEWEKAARGATISSRFWANWTVAGLANLNRPRPVSVGTFTTDVSPFGAYDMAGNVHEWVNDEYTLYSGNPVVLHAPVDAKVVRGGSFSVAPPEISPSWRASLHPAVSPGSDSPVGFRCAAEAAISRPRERSPQ